jgi:DNA polymerase kappa
MERPPEIALRTQRMSSNASPTKRDPAKDAQPALTDADAVTAANPSDGTITAHASLKYSLLGPSLTKAGQDSVDQSKVSEIIYTASKGSKFFNREEVKDKILTAKIARILAKKARLDGLDLTRELRAADALIAQLELSRDLTQSIVHLDCDAFYAAVELLDRPELADVPFAVGGGVLTTCNYVARRFGCRSGMAGFVAKKLCPQLVLLPLNFDKYNAKAGEVREVLAEYDPRFESASIDEAYLNITEYCRDKGMAPADVVEQMRREIHEKTKITVSAGIAANSKLAKICSNMNKPNGQFVLPNDRTAIMEFMRDLPCRKVNGVGRVFERELDAVGVRTCGDIYAQRQYLAQLFGDKAYEFLMTCYLGLGRTSVQPAEEYERKSVGTESTFRDMSDPTQLRDKLRSTAEELEKDMKRAEVKGRTLVLKVKLHTYEVFTRQVAPPKAVCLADDLYNYSLPMLVKLEQETPGMKLRLMGLRCTHLVSTKKPDTLAFFGLKPRRTESADSADEQSRGTRGRSVGEVAEWEQWPEDTLDTDPPDTADEASPDVREESSSPFRRHGKEIVPNPTPKKEDSLPEEEWWDCPICSRPQAANERQFNEHIDLCLSRQAIRDTVQEAAISTTAAASGSERSRSTSEKKRGRPANGGRPDPRQKKLCFG